MMDKQKNQSPPFTPPMGKSNGFKIPKKKPDDWCEEIHPSSPLTRLGPDLKNVTLRKRPYSSYESFNVPRNMETHSYYTSPGHYRLMRQPKVILTDILRSGSGRPSSQNNIAGSNFCIDSACPINSISSPTSNSTSANQVLQGSAESLSLSRTEQMLDRHKDIAMETEAKSEKRTSITHKEHAHGASLSTACRDVSNTPISPPKDFGVTKNNTEDGNPHVSKAGNVEHKNVVKSNVAGTSNTREKTYCFKRAEYWDKKASPSPTTASVQSSRDKPPSSSSSSSSSSESATDCAVKSSDITLKERAVKTSKESKRPSLESRPGNPPVNSSRSYSNRLTRLQSTSRRNLPAEPIVLSSDEEEREHEEREKVVHERILEEASVEMKEDDVCEKPSSSSHCSEVEPMDCSPPSLDLLPASDNSVLQLKFLNVYFGKKKGRAKGPTMVTPKSIEIPLQVPLQKSKCISLNTMKLQKYGFWLTNGRDSIRSNAVIVLWITTDYIPHVEKQLGEISKNQPSKSNELIFLELAEPLSGKEQSLMCKIMKEASEDGLCTLADILTWDEIHSMLEALSNEDCSFKANCCFALKKQQQESSNTALPLDPPKASKVTSSYTLIQKYKHGHYSVSMAPRQDDNLKEVDKGGKLLRLLVYPPPPTKGGLAVTNEDLECLEHGEFLNDVIIDFYLKYLLLEHFPKPFAEKCHLFSSFFFKCLTRKDNVTSDNNSEMPASQRRHHRVKTWTRHVDIFTKDFVFVPVNENSHWYLIVICFPWMEKAVYEDRKEPIAIQDVSKGDGANSGSVIVFNDHLSKKEETIGEERNSESEGSASSGISSNPKHSKHKDMHHGKLCKRPCLLVFDSLKTGSAQTAVQVLREYLKAEWDIKRKTPREFSRSGMRDLYPKVPKQNNSTDCGLYVLQYVESFAQKPIESFDPPMRLENWFPASVVKNKRDEIRDLILRLHVQQSKKS